MQEASHTNYVSKFTEVCHDRVALLQEILYPEFCAAIVRIASVRFSAIQGLNERLKKLVTQHLLPLQLSYIQLPMYTLHTDTAFVQYLQLMDPVLKILFHAVAHSVQVLSLIHI